MQAEPAAAVDLLLVDGSSYLYRAYHAMPDLRSPDGQPTGAIFGIVAMLRKLAADVPAAHRACVFDAPGKTFRDDWYADYKANRAPMPEPLVQQIEPIHRIVALLGWKVIEIPGIEADDVIGTLARRAAAEHRRCLISSGDKDLSQLVDDWVTVVDTMSGKTYDAAGVVDKFGVPPRQIVDFLTLVGDSVDNVPGVDKVGPKTAAKLLAEYGSLDALIARADEVKGAVGDNLRRALDWLPQARRLVTIKTDCDLTSALGDDPWAALVAPGEDRAALLPQFKALGFRSWTRELEAEAAAPSSAPPASSAGAGGVTGDLFGGFAAPPLPAEAHYATVLDEQALEDWAARIESAPVVALDTETTSLNEMQARIVGLSFAVAPGQACYIPVAHDYAGAPAQLTLAQVLARLRPWLEDPARAKVGQNIKYDWHVLRNHGVEVAGYADDTMLQSYVLEVHKPHGLESLAERHLGRRGLSYEDVAGKGAQQIPFAQVPVETASRYSCEDSDFCLAVQQVLAPRLAAEPVLERLYRGIELPLVEVLGRIERHGVLIDAARLAEQSAELARRLDALEREAHQAAGQMFNLGSPKQIGDILFGQLKLPVVKKTASGAPSTDEEVLEKLALDYPLPKLILEHRSLSKLKGTYTDKLPKMIDPRSGRVHTSYAQAVAVTGRLSSNDPNLQNIPIRTAEGRRVREAFVAPAGHRIASADYSQIELRIMAHISGDAALLSAFARGDDVHRATASEVFGIAQDQVTAEQRRYAKVINFGLIYGMSAFGLAANLGIERAAAQQFVDRYFQRFSGVARYMQDIRSDAKARGYVETVFGRRLYLPEINSGNGPRRGAAERQAINAPMQGTAADLIKLAMIAVDRAIREQRRGTRIVMQVHDELVFEVPEDEVDWVRDEVPKLMCGVAELKVPLLVEVGFGGNWDEAH
jgi:DNA polymerase-1